MLKSLLALLKNARRADQASELLAKLLKDEIKQRGQRNVVQSRAFSEMLQKSLTAYHNRVIAAELVTSVRQSATIDWSVRESARAKIRVMVRRILKKHGYPPDLQAEATQLVLEQAEVLCADWVT